AVSRDRGLTFSRAKTIVSASIDQLRDQFSQPAVDPKGDVYVAYTNIGTKTNVADFFVTKSTDDGATFSRPVQAGSGNTIGVASGRVTNTTFRDGINFAVAVSQDFPGHLYLAYNDFNGTQYNVFIVQSTDGGQTWSAPVAVNDDYKSGNVADHFQPAIAAGPGGAVAVAFYDRRASCPSDASIILQDRGRSNFCIDVSVQPYKDTGAGAVSRGANIRASSFTWDPQQPGLGINPDGTTTDLQKLGGLGQMACASHNDPCRLSCIGGAWRRTSSRRNPRCRYLPMEPDLRVEDRGRPYQGQAPPAERGARRSGLDADSDSSGGRATGSHRRNLRRRFPQGRDSQPGV